MAHSISKSIKVLALSSTVLIAACSVKPEHIPLKSHIERAAMDRAAIYKDVVPMQGALSLDEAIARGLLFNLDHRVGMMEETLQDNQLTLAKFNMLPRLAANAGYSWRDSERASESISLRTRTRSLEPSFSEEKNVRTADLTFSWSILDFGMSYYQAKQQSDRVLASIEKRRRVMNNLVMQIQNSYWQALAAQRVLPDVEQALLDVDEAISASKTIENEGLESPMASLEYRRSLLQVLTQLKKLKSDLTISKAQLASLMNIPQDKEFVIAEPKQTTLPSLNSQVIQLQNYALAYRPELREEAYQERIDRQNINREILRMFPAVSIIASENYDSNDLLAFNSWEQVGLRATWNLLNVLQGPKAIKTAELQVEIDQMRRMALTAAVLAQVSISASQYNQSIDGYKTAKQLSDIEAKMLQIASNAESSNEGTKLDRIQRSVQTISANLNRDRAYTDARSAFSNLLVSIGLDMIPASAEVVDLNTMTNLVTREREAIESGNLNQILQQNMISTMPTKVSVESNNIYTANELANSENNEVDVLVPEKNSFRQRIKNFFGSKAQKNEPNIQIRNRSTVKNVQNISN
jgi:outer membrane protein TolC